MNEAEFRNIIRQMMSETEKDFEVHDKGSALRCGSGCPVMIAYRARMRTLAEVLKSLNGRTGIDTKGTWVDYI